VMVFIAFGLPFLARPYAASGSSQTPDRCAATGLQQLLMAGAVRIRRTLRAFSGGTG
jgi:hypothetical protein